MSAERAVSILVYEAGEVQASEDGGFTGRTS